MIDSGQLIKAITGSLLAMLGLVAGSRANTRTLETPFALSSDGRSEFQRQFKIPSAGRIAVEANWSSTGKSAVASLTLVLFHPDGSVAERKSGRSGLRLEHAVGQQDIERLAASRETKWTVKVLNDVELSRSDVTGILRITIPAEGRALEDTQFTLLGSGNAQEIPINVPDAGRVDVEVSWEEDAPAKSTGRIPLVVSLIHPGESRTYARRQGPSPLEIDQQITEQALDHGARWIVRVENDTQNKVRGRVKVIYAPSL
jgi:hypothetical protein